MAWARLRALPPALNGPCAPASAPQHHRQGNRFDRAIRRWAPRDEVYHCCCIPRRVCYALVCILLLLIAAGVTVFVLYGDDIAGLFG